MPIPKFAFSLSLLAFLLPFLLVTCNNTETKELKPLIMQDQLVYNVQGYKILTNTFDKSGKYGEVSGSSSLFGNKHKDDLFSSGDSESSYEEKANIKYEGMRIILIVAFILVLVGLLFQFFLKHESVRKKASIIIASTTILLLVSFYIVLEILLNASQNKIEEKLGDDGSSFMGSFSNIQAEIGLGSGFYLCVLGQLIVLDYYLFFIKRYSVVKNIEPKITYSTPADSSTPTSSETL